MPILLCAATTFEIQPTIEFIKKQGLAGIDILITGVGLTATTYHLTKAVYTHRPHFILQAGIAGALDEQLSLTKVVAVKNETIGDLGVEENGTFNPVFNLKLGGKDAFPWTNGHLCNTNEMALQAGLPLVNSVTINEITTNPQRIQYYKKELGAAIESMEGAALHYVALLEKIPFLQIRSLSNFVGERDKSKWEMDKAIFCLNLELQRVIVKLMDL